MHRTPSARAHQQRRIRHHAANTDSYAFFNLLTGPGVFDHLESLLPDHRERLFPPTETLSMFLSQALSADRSCQKAVNDAAIKRVAGGLTSCSARTGACRQARKRLPVEMVSALTRHTGRLIAHQAPPVWHWQGRPVRLVDGATLPMPDTSSNQAAYSQPRSQKPGAGFPLCRMAGIVCPGSGAVLNAAIGRYQGKGGDEQSLPQPVLDTLDAGGILLGDAYYATYFLLSGLQSRGVDAVFEQLGARKRRTGFRRGRRLGSRDHLITIARPQTKPGWMAQSDYDHARLARKEPSTNQRFFRYCGEWRIRRGTISYFQPIPSLNV